MGFVENVLRLRDEVSSDEGLEKLRRIFEKEDPNEVRGLQKAEWILCKFFSSLGLKDVTRTTSRNAKVIISR